jgi:hypothetical protein
MVAQDRPVFRGPLTPVGGGRGDPLVYPVVLKITGDGIDVEYPSLGCAGILHPLAFRDGELRTREEITRGSGNCAQGVEVILRPGDSKHMDADFYLGGLLVAKGSLVRTPAFP